MCRRNLLPGLALTTFGVGVLIGMWLEFCFAGLLICIPAICIGIMLLQKP